MDKFYINLQQSSQRCIDWVVKEMLNFEKGKWGVYERIIASQSMKIDDCRSDTATEVLIALVNNRAINNTDKYDEIIENLTNWLVYAQQKYFAKNSGSFPFALPNGVKRPKKKLFTLWQNDSGKVLINLIELYKLTQDTRYYEMAEKLANFLLDIQREDGLFFKKGIHMNKVAEGPCYVLWPMVGLYSASAVMKEKKYFDSAEKAYQAFLKMVENGRVLTCWEYGHAEPWRPESSENYIALLTLALSYKITKDDKFLKEIEELWPFCKTLIDEKTGAVKNGVVMKGSTIETDPSMCDLVYTEGFALHAYIELYNVTGKEEYINLAKKMAEWLMEIQCGEEDLYYVRGGWRGSYSLDRKGYYGICDNQANEGGADSIYVGWSSIVNVMGFQKLIGINKK